MPKLKTVIIEDFEEQADDLKRMLLTHFALFEIIKTHPNAEDAIKAIHKDSAEVYFIDIGLPKKKGYEVPNEVYNETGIQPVVVFITGEYTSIDTMQVFKSECVVADYILKGFDEERLQITVLRIKKIFNIT